MNPSLEEEETLLPEDLMEEAAMMLNLDLEEEIEELPEVGSKEAETTEAQEADTIENLEEDMTESPEVDHSTESPEVVHLTESPEALTEAKMTEVLEREEDGTIEMMRGRDSRESPSINSEEPHIKLVITCITFLS
jgi:hypothetical protein